MVRRDGDPRTGASLVESVVALLVGLLVLQLGLGTLARFRAAQSSLSSRSDALLALRVGRHVLRGELRQGVAERDWSTGADSVALRAFRGTGLVCANDSVAAELTVTYRGERTPDPTKDSVLVITAEGRVEARALRGVGTAASSCVAPGVRQRLRMEVGAPSGTVAVRVFERGSYYLSDAALRYRRGASGRQPLTPEVWSPATGWERSSERLGLAVVPSGSSGSPWKGFLAWRTPE